MHGRFNKFLKTVVPSAEKTFATLKSHITMSSVVDRTIQDPGSQRLTWYKAPQTVLIIKKIWDEMLDNPFLELIEWLVEVLPELILLSFCIVRVAQVR